MYWGRTETIRKEGEEVVPELAIPFAAKADLDLTQTGDELTMHVGAYKRKVVLPQPLMGRAVSAQSS
jgi:arsenite-transporting ATPase